MLLTAFLLAAGLAIAPQQASGARDVTTITQSHPLTQTPQDKANAQKPPTPPHTGIHALFRNLGDDFKHLPAKDNVSVALIGGGLAATARPADSTFNVHLRSHYTLVNNIYKPAHLFGDTPEQVALSLGAYAYGRIFDAPKVSHLGMDLLTFAAATVIERHLGWRRSVLGYAVASYVASSRLHDNRHYLSDVVFGAAVGTIAGRTVTQHGRDVWTFAPVSVPGGIAIVAARMR